MKPPVAIAYIALGANLDDPVRQVREAIGALASLPGARLVAASSLYRTAPVGVVGQPDFINAVAAVETGQTPPQLLAALLALEARFGRIRRGGVDPRTLDLDLLLYGDQVLDQPNLTLPHPRLHLRAFVLAPLLEIAPDCRIPGRGSAAAWWPAVANQAIERLS
jgi:2-amino-4-hydroxy-6-hydroxymethyldihydropteridine diphosphokinase